jgi:TRAP-type mannitol/chloroaromatic compound transport system substrate-binding protein
MDRRLFLGAGLAALAACSSQHDCEEGAAAGASAHATKKAKIKWKIVTSWPKNFPGLGTAPERFAGWLREITQGEFELKVYGAGEIVPALEVFDAVSRGTVQMGHSAAYYWKGKLAAAPFFTAVPFGLNAQEQNGGLHHGGGLDLWRELYAPYNLVPFAAGNTGVQMAGWFNKKIESVEDIKGLKMRIPGLAGEVWQRLGGTPVTLPGGELFTALQTGAIDASEWVGPFNDLAFGFHKVAKYYYYPGWHEPSATLELVVNKSAYDKLPVAFQEAISLAARAANQDMHDEYTARNAQALKELVSQHGVKVLKLPDSVLKALYGTSLQVIETLIEKDAGAQKVYESYQTYQQQSMDYTALSELAYLEARHGQNKL